MRPFRYFRVPTHPLSSWNNGDGICHFCGNAGPGFNGPYYGPEDIDWVCETCLRSGRLSEIDGAASDGDEHALREQLVIAKPRLSKRELDAVVAERNAELQTRTPALLTWQDFYWPAHCGDYCEFVEELGRPEVLELAGEEDPMTWLCERSTDGATAWKRMRHNSAREFPDESYNFTVYRFVCRVCAANVIHWDAS